MIRDYEQELTTAGGQAITADAYGTKNYDQKAAADPAVGEPLFALFEVNTTFTDLTSLNLSVRMDSDGAGTDEVTKVTKNVTLASGNLDSGLGPQLIGVVPPGTSLRYLRAHFDSVGTDPTAGNVTVWLVKGVDALPENLGAAYV